MGVGQQPTLLAASVLALALLGASWSAWADAPAQPSDGSATEAPSTASPVPSDEPAAPPAASADGSGADAAAELAALREAARIAAENIRLVTRTASAAVDLALRSGNVRLAAREARTRAERALEPARFAVESEEERIALVRTALGAAGDLVRTGVEVARLRSWIVRIEEYEASDTQRRQMAADRHQTRLDLAGSVAVHLDDPESAVSADTLYTTVVSELEAARGDLAAALDDASAPSAIPPRLRRAVPDHIAAALPELAAEYELATATWARLDAAELAARRERIAGAAQAVFALNTARLALIPRLSRAARERVLGLGEEGLAQGRREIAHLRLLARWYRHDRWSRLEAVADRTLEWLTVASLRYALMRLLLLAAVALLLLRRPDAWLDRVAVWVRARSGAGNTLPHWWQPTRGTLPDALVLVVTLLALRELLVLAPVGEVQLLGRVATAIAAYRVVLSGTHQTLLWGAASAYVPVSQSVSDRMRGSLRLAGRVAMAISVYLIVAEHLLGRGYLYRVVRQSAWVLAFPVAWWILRHWSSDVLSLYRRRLPNGALASLIERHGEGPLRSLLVLPAAVPLVARAAVVGARATAYRFERSRRALSYLFLRRLERRQASRATAPGACALEDDVASAIVAPLQPDEVADVWPRSAERLLDHLQRWSAGHELGSAAVVGERGVGKTAFVAHLLRSVGNIPVVTVPLPLHAVQPERLLATLASAVGAPEGIGANDLIRHLMEGPRRVLVLDDVQRCSRRVPGGQEAYLVLLDLIAHTGQRVYWVCTYGAFAWRWLQYATAGRALHALVVRLEPWPDNAIERLIRGRMDALGLIERYDDLIEELPGAEARALRLLETRDDFFRLVRDHADGVPRAALEVWASALLRHPDGSVHVQPLDTWEADDLEFLDEDGRFVVGAIVAQVDIEPDVIARVLRMPPERVEAVLARLRVMGVVSGVHGAVRVADPWQRAAVAFARRKQLIAPG